MQLVLDGHRLCWGDSRVWSGVEKAGSRVGEMAGSGEGGGKVRSRRGVVGLEGRFLMT